MNTWKFMLRAMISGVVSISSTLVVCSAYGVLSTVHNKHIADIGENPVITGPEAVYLTIQRDGLIPYLWSLGGFALYCLMLTWLGIFLICTLYKRGVMSLVLWPLLLGALGATMYVLTFTGVAHENFPENEQYHGDFVLGVVEVVRVFGWQSLFLQIVGVMILFLVSILGSCAVFSKIDPFPSARDR